MKNITGLAGFLAMMVFLVTACPPQVPLGIRKISAESPPKVGEIVTLYIRIRSTRDEEHVEVTLEEMEAWRGVVHVISPGEGWSGSLIAKESEDVAFDICVLQAGEWPLWVWARSQLATGSSYGDQEVIIVRSTENSGKLFRRGDYLPSGALVSAEEPLDPTDCMIRE